MKRILFSLCLFVFTTNVFAAPGAILRKLNTPANGATGLTFDGTNLWVADRISDSLYAVNPADGKVTQALPAPGYIPLGLAWDGEALWIIDGEDQFIHRLDVHTGLTLRSIESPTHSAEGLTWHNGTLWISDGREDVVCQISPQDGTIIERFRAPHDNATGLTFWNGYLVCGDRRTDRIYLMSPEHGGEVVVTLDAPNKYVRGLTVIDDHLWAADYQSDKLYQIVLEDEGEFVTSNEQTLNLTLTHEFRNYGPGIVPELDVYLALPADMPSQKLVADPTFTPEPTNVVQDRWNHSFAHFHMENPPLAERVRAAMNVTATLYDFRRFIFPHRVKSLKDIPKDVRKAYLVDEDKYRIHDPRITDALKTIVGNETNPYWIMRAIHRAIRERLHYELSGGWNVAPRVWERGNGSCSEYTFLFISMCRAAGIPARYVGSVVVRGDQAASDDVFHRWAQAYIPGYGWIHVDAQGGDKERPADIAASIGTLSNRFLITTVGGGNSDILGWQYNYVEHHTAKGPVKIHVESVGEWSPVE